MSSGQQIHELFHLFAANIHSLPIPCWMVLNKMVKIRCLETLPTNTQSKKNNLSKTGKDWGLRPYHSGRD